MHTVLSWHTPTTRSDGSPLAVTDIASITIWRNDNVVNAISGASVTAGAMSYTDTTPNGVSDKYAVEITATDGTSSGPSNVATTVVAPKPAPVSDLSATLFA